MGESSACRVSPVNRKGMLIGCLSYAALYLVFAALSSGSRSGDMPFGYEMLLWPIVMLPLGLIGLLAPAFGAKMAIFSNELFGSYSELDSWILLGNWALWIVFGGLFGRIFRRKS